MRRIYFTRVSAQLGFLTGIKQQLLPQLIIGHVKMMVSLGPQGTLVIGMLTVNCHIIDGVFWYTKHIHYTLAWI
jgi:hypothetical protein